MRKTPPIDIPSNGAAQPLNTNAVSMSRSPAMPSSLGASTSPTTSTLHDRFRQDTFPNGISIRQPKVLRPVERDELRLLLLENISMDAVKAFRTQGFQVDHFTKSWSEDELVEKIGSYHAIGIRSKTRITERVLKAASKACHLIPSVLLRVDLTALFFFRFFSAPRYRMLLHRHKPGRPHRSLPRWCSSLQLSVLQLAFSRRARHVRNHRAFAPALR